MSWAAFVDVLDHPASIRVAPDFVKRGANREASRNTPYRLMKEDRVARSQAPNKLMHPSLECFWILKRENAVPALTSKRRPIRPVETGIEVSLRDLSNGLIEDLCALVEGQFGWSRV
jgi:hypothetical protein